MPVNRGLGGSQHAVSQLAASRHVARCHCTPTAPAREGQTKSRCERADPALAAGALAIPTTAMAQNAVERYRYRAFSRSAVMNSIE